MEKEKENLLKRFAKNNAEKVIPTLLATGIALLVVGTELVFKSGKELLAAGLIILGLGCVFARDYFKPHSNKYVDSKDIEE